MFGYDRYYEFVLRFYSRRPFALRWESVGILELPALSSWKYLQAGTSRASETSFCTLRNTYVGFFWWGMPQVDSPSTHLCKYQNLGFLQLQRHAPCVVLQDRTPATPGSSRGTTLQDNEQHLFRLLKQISYARTHPSKTHLLRLAMFAYTLTALHRDMHVQF